MVEVHQEALVLEQEDGQPVAVVEEEVDLDFASSILQRWVQHSTCKLVVAVVVEAAAMVLQEDSLTLIHMEMVKLVMEMVVVVHLTLPMLEVEVVEEEVPLTVN